jgi:hypothetical protein
MNVPQSRRQCGDGAVSERVPVKHKVHLQVDKCRGQAHADAKPFHVRLEHIAKYTERLQVHEVCKRRPLPLPPHAVRIEYKFTQARWQGCQELCQQLLRHET